MFTAGDGSQGNMSRLSPIQRQYVTGLSKLLAMYSAGAPEEDVQEQLALLAQVREQMPVREWEALEASVADTPRVNPRRSTGCG